MDDAEYEAVMRMVTSPEPLSEGPGVVIPPVLYLPVRVDAAGRPAAMVWERDGGDRALLAFTALDRLASQCGSEQPWVLVELESLSEIKEVQPFDSIAFDPTISSRFTQSGALA